MKIEINSNGNAGIQVRLEGALVADIAIAEAITATQRDDELRLLRPLRVASTFFSEFLQTLSKLSASDLARFCEGVADGAKGFLIPHPTEKHIHGVLKSYEHHYQTGYRFGEGAKLIGKQPVFASTNLDDY